MKCVVLSSVLLFSLLEVTWGHPSKGTAQPAVCGPKPDFKASGQRISEQKCREFNWEKKCSTEGELNKYSYMGAVAYSKNNVVKFLCNAVLISPKFAVTAGHCAKGWYDLIPEFVRFGNQNFKGVPVTDAKIIRTIMHPQFKWRHVTFDIALLEFEQALPVSRSISPACLWAKPEIATNQDISVSAWAAARLYNWSNIDVLRTMTVQVIDDKTCAPLVEILNYRNFRKLEDHHLCVNETDTENLFDVGSTGAPLVTSVSLGDGDEMPYAQAFLNTGLSTLNNITIFTKISSFVRWIEETVWPESFQSSDSYEDLGYGNTKPIEVKFGTQVVTSLRTDIGYVSLLEEVTWGHPSKGMAQPPVCGPKPDFKAPGQRISEQKCREFNWEKKCSTEGELNKYSYMGAVAYPKNNKVNFLCNAFLISPKFAVTAAQCVKSRHLIDLIPEFVRFGNQNLKGVPVTDAKIVRKIAHPQFKAPRKPFDIALLEFEQALPVSRSISPACLWAKPEIATNQDIPLSAWANTEEDTNIDVLRTMTIQVIDRNTCLPLIERLNYRDSRELADHHLCANESDTKNYFFRGSAGAPLVTSVPLGDGDEMPYVQAFASFGYQSSHIGVYIKISNFVQWIEETVWPESFEL